MSHFDHSTNCLPKSVTIIDDAEKNMDGAGECNSCPESSLEDVEIDPVVSHSGQGDFAESCNNETPKVVESLSADNVNEIYSFGVQHAVVIALHPLEYAKALVQMGHEPLPIETTINFLGQPVKRLPNLFKCVSHIKNVDGFSGCFRGLVPKLVGSIISFAFVKKLQSDVDYFSKKRKNDLSFEQFASTLKCDLILTTTSLIISHPFHIISMRMMAQFVGRETVYRTVFGSFLEIYRIDGIKGFFAGLMPKLLSDVSCVVLTSSLHYLLKKYVVKDKLAEKYDTGMVQFVIAAMLYPLQVVSTCMMVSNSGLMAGKPPKMSDYKNWIDCWLDLESRGEHRRGSSVFWRSTPDAKQILAIPNKAA